MDKKEYIKPRFIRIERWEETEGLYQAEGEVLESAKKAINEWMKITKSLESEYWTKAVPQHLFDYLESWDRNAAELAAVAFLEMRGYKIESKREEE